MFGPPFLLRCRDSLSSRGAQLSALRLVILCRGRSLGSYSRAAEERAEVEAQLGAYDQVAEKKGAGNALFKEIEASQKAYAERVLKWDFDNNVRREMAYNHYFGAKAPAGKKS